MSHMSYDTTWLKQATATLEASRRNEVASESYGALEKVGSKLGSAPQLRTP